MNKRRKEEITPQRYWMGKNNFDLEECLALVQRPPQYCTNKPRLIQSNIYCLLVSVTRPKLRKTIVRAVRIYISWLVVHPNKGFFVSTETSNA